MAGPRTPFLPLATSEEVRVPERKPGRRTKSGSHGSSMGKKDISSNKSKTSRGKGSKHKSFGRYRERVITDERPESAVDEIQGGDDPDLDSKPKIHIDVPVAMWVCTPLLVPPLRHLIFN